MKTRKLIRCSSLLLFLLFCFNVLSLALSVNYGERDAFNSLQNGEVVHGNDKTTSLDTKQELLSKFEYEMGEIRKIEYFFDTDPGFGNGIALEFSTGTEIIIDEAIVLIIDYNWRLCCD